MRTGERRGRLTALAASVLLALACLMPTALKASVPRGTDQARGEPPRIASLAPPDDLSFQLLAGDELGRALDQVDGSSRFTLGVAPEELDARVLALVSRVREIGFHPLQGLDLIDAEPLRGPPEREPKTRIGGLELFEPFAQREEPRLTLGLQWRCGPGSCEIASGQRFDPLGLAVKKTRSRTALTPGRWSVPPGTMAPAPVGVDPPGFIPGGVVDVASATSTGNAAVELGELRQIGLDDVTGMEVLSSHYPGGEGERGRVQAIASKVSPLQKPAMVGLLLMTPFMGPVPGGGTPLQLGLKFESMTAAAPVLESAGTAVAVETGSTAISPASFGYKTIAEDATLHRLWEGAMKGAATSSRGNKYQELLALWETGGTPSQELLEQGFGTVNQRFLSAAREAGYDIAQVHHWNFRKASFPNQVFDPRNLVPTPSRAVHQSMHQATTSGTNIWADDIAVEHQLAIDDSHYPLAPRTP